MGGVHRLIRGLAAPHTGSALTKLDGTRSLSRMQRRQSHNENGSCPTDPEVSAHPGGSQGVHIRVVLRGVHIRVVLRGGAHPGDSQGGAHPGCSQGGAHPGGSQGGRTSGWISGGGIQGLLCGLTAGTGGRDHPYASLTSHGLLVSLFSRTKEGTIQHGGNQGRPFPGPLPLGGHAVKRCSRHTSHVTRHTSHVPRHTSHVARHTSHVTRHMSCITRHTSHVTRHTSHVTRHTAGLADHSPAQGFSHWVTRGRFLG